MNEHALDMENILPETLSGDDAEENLVYIISGGRVGDRRDKSVFKKSERDAQYEASVTIIRDKDGNEQYVPTMKVWFKSQTRKTVAAVTWRPGAPEITHAPDGAASGGRTDAFNTWRGLPPYEAPADWENRVWSWDEHIEYLVPDETTRARFNMWLAHMVQKPGELPSTAFCMIAETHGIGRNWMASVLTRVLRGYVRASLSLQQLFEKSFNGTISQKLLAVVDEVHERHTCDRYAVANRLRQLITAEHSEINAKCGGNWIEHNCIRWLFFSNYLDALPVGDGDRRIEFIENPKECMSEAYYTQLFAELKDPLFIASVRHRHETTDISGFNPGQHAAKTKFRAATIDASEGALEAGIREYLRIWPGEITTLEHLCGYLRTVAGDRDLSKKYVGNIARQFGLYLIKPEIRIRPDAETRNRENVMFVGGLITEDGVRGMRDKKTLTNDFRE